MSMWSGAELRAGAAAAEPALRRWGVHTAHGRPACGGWHPAQPSRCCKTFAEFYKLNVCALPHPWIHKLETVLRGNNQEVGPLV